MKKLFLLIVIALTSTNINAQINLVLNPSFESYAQCQYRINNIKYANYWTPIVDTFFSATDTLGPGECTPELCSTCIPFYSSHSVPLSAYYNHYPRTGNNMAYIITYYKEDFDTLHSVRDYLQGRLRNQLINGHTYSCFFHISLTQSSPYAHNNMGAFLDDGTIDTTTRCGWPQTMHVPQINDTSIYTDTLNWKKIEGTFTSNGSERFITIGNFFDGAHTDTVFLDYWNFPSKWFGSYLIDDVGVIDCNNIPHAGNDTTIRQGDTIYLGTHEQLLPYKWYVKGNSVAIDSGSGTSVHPSSTTTYILEQKMCDMIKYDTIKVTVIPIGVETLANEGEYLSLFPNPAANELTIQNAANCEVAIYDVMGRKIATKYLMTNKEMLDVSGLIKGIYLIEIIDAASGERVKRQIVKQ